MELIGMGVSPDRCKGRSFHPCAAIIKEMSAFDAVDGSATGT
jgi:hypothetical protein